MNQSRTKHPPQGPASQIATGLSKVSMVLRNHAWNEAAPEGLSATQAQILVALARASSAERAMVVGELARELGVTAATASDSIAALAEKGLVHKSPSPEDRRRVEIMATPKGSAMARELAQWPDFLLNAIGAMDEGEQGVLLRAVTKMIRSMQEQGKVPISRMCVSCRFFRPHAHANADAPHHCEFVDAPFGDSSLRLECPDHERAPDDAMDRVYQVFVRGAPAKRR